ncbi:MAG TPA: TIGR03621 family F420-dependent LLM class oxidoreductase [Acidimicrobiia bacterium]|nr:TIGR03621 family F420-dependent LLM class oxidoreductase [Acidimicrobiia bacterium]
MAHDRKFRFGVQTGGATSAREWTEKARKVEALGYSTLYMPDHFIDTPFAPMVGIAAAAEVTDSLRVGTLVLGNDYKHPAVVAKEFATLDVISDGRVEAGIGAGWMRIDYEALGLPYDRAGTRIERLEEAIAVMKGAWGAAPFSFDGAHYRITNYDGLPKPAQQPHPPLFVGGGGRRLLTLAAREADIIGFTPAARAGEITTDQARETLPALWTEKFDWVREAAGDRFADIELQIRYFFAAITDDRRGLAEAAAPAFGISADEALESGVALVGTVDECCDLLVRRREEWGVSYIALGDNEYEAFAPVVARLAGT